MSDADAAEGAVLLGGGGGGGGCGGAALRQERPCRKGRCKRRAFHVVLPPRRESLRQPSAAAQADVRVMFSLNSIFYSAWSRWTACTKSCTTTRYRSVSRLSLATKPNLT